METIHVAYALDDNYAEMTCVSMASLLYNTKNPVHFHVVESRLSDENKAKLVELGERFPHGEWSFYNVSGYDIINYFIVENYWTIEAYYRFFLPKLLLYLDKVIYLDGDTIIEKNIIKLWNVELSGMYAAAVGRNPIIYNLVDLKRKKILLEMNETGFYFNSGVMLLNLTRLRDFDFETIIQEKIPYLYQLLSDNDIGFAPDQDILNYLIWENCIRLPFEYNFWDNVNIIMENAENISDNLCEFADALLNPIIIHYVGGTKPVKITKYIGESLHWESYYKYKAFTPFANIKIDKMKITKYYELEKHLDNTLIYDVDKFINYRRNKLLCKLANELSNKLINKKLAIWGVGDYTGYLMAILATRDIYTDIVVDGLPEKQGTNIFHYTIENPEILNSRSDEYYVLLAMQNYKPAAAVSKVLVSYGYDSNSFEHVYAPLWDIINEEL